MESTEIIELPALQISSYAPPTALSDDLASLQEPEVSTELPTQGENQIQPNQVRPFLSGCMKRLVPAATLLGVIVAALAIWPSIEALEYIKWTAQKDYLEFCLSEARKQLSPSCSMIGNYTLPPPPHSFSTHHVISERSSISHEHLRTSLGRGLDQVHWETLFSSSSLISARFFSNKQRQIATPASIPNILLALLFFVKREAKRRHNRLKVTPLFHYADTMFGEGNTMFDDGEFLSDDEFMSEGEFLSDDESLSGGEKQQWISGREHLDEPIRFFTFYRVGSLWFDSLKLSWFETAAYLLADVLVKVLVDAMMKSPILTWLEPESGPYDPRWTTLNPIFVILCDHMYTNLSLIDDQLPKRGPHSIFRYGDREISRLFRKSILLLTFGIYAKRIIEALSRIVFLGLSQELYQGYSGK